MEDLIINGDSHKISSVFRNLLSNALKFTPQYGRVVLRVVGLFADKGGSTASYSLKHVAMDSVRRVLSSAAISPFSVHTSSPKGQRSSPPATLWLRIEVSDSGPGISKVCFIY